MIKTVFNTDCSALIKLNPARFGDIRMNITMYSDKAAPLLSSPDSRFRPFRSDPVHRPGKPCGHQRQCKFVLAKPQMEITTW